MAVRPLDAQIEDVFCKVLIFIISYTNVSVYQRLRLNLYATEQKNY